MEIRPTKRDWEEGRSFAISKRAIEQWMNFKTEIIARTSERERLRMNGNDAKNISDKG